ncbi:MAG: serine/threonine protein kinase, partial [Kiritimatiellae bacterium]|nr:serine/threonine protein kinase [Kiritimatiellia bacterium]
MKVDEDDNTLGDFLARHGSVGAKPAFADGTEIGEWRITGFIGRGGSSEVYCVRNGATGEPAALKILHRTEQQHLDRFAREVHFLETHAGMAVSPSVGSRVPRDRHFPRFFAKGTCDGRPYVVQELLEPLPLPRGEHEIARFLCSVAEGVRDLHACGLVHRDIKPANILWRVAEPVIVDFGLLKEITTAPIRPSENISVVDGKEVGVGTPRYAAPEQFTGGEATPATDIHALGRLAYECFDGHPPRVWSGIIRRATSSIPKERYQTAGEFIRAIQLRRRPRRMLAVLLGTALVVGLVTLLMPNTGRLESTSVKIPATSEGEERGQWTLSGMDVTTNVIQLVFHHQILVTN